MSLASGLDAQLYQIIWIAPLKFRQLTAKAHGRVCLVIRFDLGRRADAKPGNGEEVDGGYLCHVVADEGLPGLGRWTGPAYHVFGDRRLADVVAQLHQLTVDMRRTPESIIL